MTQQEIQQIFDKANAHLTQKHGKSVHIKIKRDPEALLYFDIVFESYEGENKLANEDIQAMFNISYIVMVVVKNKLIEMFRKEANIDGNKLSEHIIEIHFEENVKIKSPKGRLIDITKYL